MSTTPGGSPQVPLWSRFTADPRLRPELRVGDQDRDVALSVINDAFGEGRLDQFEHDQRMRRALQARTLGEVAPLVDDIVVGVAPAGRPVSARRRVQEGALRAWCGVALLFNVIWLATWLFSANGPYYYWPIWPMIGTAIPAAIPFVLPDRRPPRGGPPPVLPPR